ncbi:MAG: DUF1513 domain-containing protein [Alphaproteobacteria bacterium]|nr:DUF1513 domain-containing protein [Alphaproteobacteria bacterium]
MGCYYDIMSDMLCSRRAFLAGMSAFIVSACVDPKLRLGADSVSLSGRHFVVGGEKDVFVADIAAQTLRITQVNFKTHSFLPHPHDPDKIWAIERWGPNIAEIDCRECRVTHSFHGPEKTWFFGHGVAAPGSDLIFISSVSLDTGRGHLLGYDVRTRKLVADVDVASGTLHECHALPDGTALIASSGASGLNMALPELGARLEPTALIRSIC